MKNYKLFSLVFFLLILPFSLSAQSEEFISLFEKVELEELPPAEEYYIDDSPLKSILKLFDEEDYERQKKFLEEKNKKIITSIGNIKIPSDFYVQNIIHDYIARYLTQFGRENLCSILDNGEVYRFFVQKKIKNQKLPSILEYLPVVESEYKPGAKSRSGALGLWQFMENSMSPFLKKNSYYDERLDPWKSTEAALSKLSDNYKMFNDWPLAIAAYNCGAGAVKRALKASPVKTYWYLAENNLIPLETIHYVPKLLAIAEICENSDEYKIQIPEITPKVNFDNFEYVTVKKSVSLNRLAAELRLDYPTLKKLNNSLLHDKTPVNSEFILRLPEGLKNTAEEILRSL